MRFDISSVLTLMLVAVATPSWANGFINYELIDVGHADNANDSTGHGAVDLEYRIGKYEVTIQQYTNFLNAVDPDGTNAYGLYNSAMGVDGNIRGILFSSGSASGQKYSPVGSVARPITYVSWFDAARFANWMTNGQGNGSTETGAYTLVGGQTSGTAPSKNPGAAFYIPTENEWYKAAYYSPLLNSGSGGYYRYATQSDTDPGNVVGGGANQANYRVDPDLKYSVTQSSIFDANQNYLTTVGVFTNASSYFGTFDQNGNVWEWNDLTGAADVSRGIRGGSWDDDIFSLSSSFGTAINPSLEANIFGFRLASPVPEPAGCASLLAGLACGGMVLRRRHWASTLTATTPVPHRDW